MASVFTRIIAGELPGRFVWKDDVCVAFLSIAPLKPGHTLVVPRVEIDHWLDLDPATLAHLTAVAQTIGAAQQQAFRPVKVGLIVAGLEVSHVHLHVVPITSERDLQFANADLDPKPADMDAAADRLRGELLRRGHDAASRPAAS